MELNSIRDQQHPWIVTDGAGDIVSRHRTQDAAESAAAKVPARKGRRATVQGPEDSDDV